MKSTFRRRNGMALVISLICIVIATILVVGYTVSMRLERQASAAMANSERANIIAQNAIEHASALLDNNIPQPVPPGQAPTPQNWIVNPGLLTKWDGSDPVEIPLSTNAGKAAPTADFVNLNASPSGSGNYPIIPTGESIPVSWVYVREDPMQPAGANNPIVGRYAFWMDDESAKINLNMAYGKPPPPKTTPKIDLSKVNPLQQVTDLDLYGTTTTDPYTDPHAAAPDSPTGLDPDYGTTGDYPDDPDKENLSPPKITASQMANVVGALPRPRYFPLWHPTAINLDLLGSSLDRVSLADWIYNDSTLATAPASPRYRLLSSPEQVKRFVSSNPEAFYQQNKFFLTTSSRSPEFNVFGKSRIFLERRYPDLPQKVPDKPSSNQPIFFQADYDATGPTYFHGFENEKGRNLTGIQHVRDAISDILNRNDWPGMPQQSFVEKWGGGLLGKLEADQVAANIETMGQYAAGAYDITTGSGRGMGWTESIEPLSTSLSYSMDPTKAAGTKWPARMVRKGKLSQKAIVPLFPRPLVNEIAFVITAEPTSPPGDAYRLKVTSQVEFYQPEKVPLVNIRRGAHSQAFLLTHLSYTAAGIDENGQPVIASQAADSYATNSGPSGGVRPGMGKLNASLQPPLNGNLKATLLVRPGSYKVVPADLPFGSTHRDFYIRNDFSGAYTDGRNFSHTIGATGSKGAEAPPPNSTGPIYFKGTVNISGYLRAVNYTVLNDDNYPVVQLLPVWDNSDGSNAMKDDMGTGDRIHFEFEINLADGPTFTRSIQIADPRLGGLANQWVMTPEKNGWHSLGFPNPAATEVADKLNADELAYYDSQNYFYNESPRGSIGMLASVPTGMQRGLIGETLKFQPSGDDKKIPDWVLLDLLAPSIWPHTYMNSTLGKVNVNADIYPNIGSGKQRWVPLQAVFQYMRPDTTVTAGATSMNSFDASSVVRNILDHKLATGGHDFGAPERYDYVGELCEIAGVADTGATNWEKEALIRNLANILTTQSNTFSVWGVAQVMRKKSGNTNYGIFEQGDQVIGERKFQAIVDRHVWPGRDGVPGNGRVSNGTYNALASPPVYPNARVPWDAPYLPIGSKLPDPSAVWAVIDGPDAPTYTPSSSSWAAVQDSTKSSTALGLADNPLRALMKYRVSSLRYLNE